MNDKFSFHTNLFSTKIKPHKESKFIGQERLLESYKLREIFGGTAKWQLIKFNYSLLICEPLWRLKFNSNYLSIAFRQFLEDIMC